MNGSGQLCLKSPRVRSFQESELDLTPKEFANFSPGFPTLREQASERVKEPDGTLSELGVQCWLIDPG